MRGQWPQWPHFVLGASIIRTGYALLCYCHRQCPETSVNSTCHAKDRCFSSVEEVIDPDTGRLEPERSYGCLPAEETGYMQCQGRLVPHHRPWTIACCSTGDFCNRNLFPSYRANDDGLTDSDPSESGAPMSSIPHVVLLSTVLFCFLLLTLLLLLAYFRYRRRESRQRSYLVASRSYDPFLGPASSLKDVLEHSSGSGSGLPILVQRTIARQLRMEGKVGQGRFGEVWLARWRGEKVAVKVFSTSNEQSWFRETEIYQTVLMRHDNVLGFVAADMNSAGSWAQLILVTEYHEAGSLHDYLQCHTFGVQELVSLTWSAAAGLAHLHTEVFGMPGKRAIAHRDVKSKNILVKRDGQCCIADFGLAARLKSEDGSIDLPLGSRAGTLRYSPPEVLDGTIPKDSFDALKAADMYSFALVLWECLLRCATGGEEGVKLVEAEEYRLPYAEWVGGGGCVEECARDDIKRTVCLNKWRPPLSPRWEQDKRLLNVVKVMTECWNPNSAVRQSALRAKKTLAKYREDECAIKMV